MFSEFITSFVIFSSFKLSTVFTLVSSPYLIKTLLFFKKKPFQKESSQLKAKYSKTCYILLIFFCSHFLHVSQILLLIFVWATNRLVLTIYCCFIFIGFSFIGFIFIGFGFIGLVLFIYGCFNFIFQLFEEALIGGLKLRYYLKIS